MIRYVAILLAVFFPFFSAFAHPVLESPDARIDISSIDYFQEQPNSPLSLLEAKKRFQNDEATSAKTSSLTFGISNKATWIRLSVYNDMTQTVQRRLRAGQIWVEKLDVYLVHDGDVLSQWRTGDGQPANRHLLPDIGYVFNVQLPPGASSIYIRGYSLDPLTLPIQLQDYSVAQLSDVISHMISGLLYGVLLTLIGYNVVLYLTLKQTVSLYYCLYISCFIIMNLGYSGYAFAWMYPNSPLLQNYATLFFMVFHGVCGLLFVACFLNLPTRMPKANRVLKTYSIIAVAASIVLCVTQQHLWGSFLSFSFLAITTLMLIGIGVVNLGKTADSVYFLVAVTFSMFGLFITTLSVWGIIPYTYIGYNGAGYGVLIEASILAIILANRLKGIEQERITANYLASYDPLTQLRNRRSFVDVGRQRLHSDMTGQSPTSFVMMDIDHFKRINDTYGHHVGDKVLTHVATFLKENVRTQDVLARWGGEEMVLLLSDMDKDDACAFAESLRERIENMPLQVDEEGIDITISFGVACTQSTNRTLDSLYKKADIACYQAKSLGRNRVEVYR